jgi:N6-L-threonylcarbamoyladenine synthase
MITLGIETSCDDTALALMETRGEGDDFECRVISSMVHSQASLHSPYGGVFPALAKREHGKNLVPLLEKLLKESGLDSKDEISSSDLKICVDSFGDDFISKDRDLFSLVKSAKFLEKIPMIDRIAVTEGPGLEPALWVGINFARVMGKIWNVPVVPINHMEGHVVASLLKSDISGGEWQKLNELQVPSVALLVSGGHTELVKIESFGHYELIGQTKDDAVGEAYDKVARLLGLPYPGGPQISKLAAQADEEELISEIKLPRPMIGSGDLNFSFSGLKTAVLYAVRELTKDSVELSEQSKKMLALEFEHAVSETLEVKLRNAIDEVTAQSIIVGGGVSANTRLRGMFGRLAEEYGIPLYLPSAHTSGDNALMIALVGAMKLDIIDGAILKADGTKRLA